MSYVIGYLVAVNLVFKFGALTELLYEYNKESITGSSTIEISSQS